MILLDTIVVGVHIHNANADDSSMSVVFLFLFFYSAYSVHKFFAYVFTLNVKIELLP